MKLASGMRFQGTYEVTGLRHANINAANSIQGAFERNKTAIENLPPSVHIRYEHWNTSNDRVAIRLNSAVQGPKVFNPGDREWGDLPESGGYNGNQRESLETYSMFVDRIVRQAGDFAKLYRAQ